MSRYYTEEHEWIESGTVPASVGITSYAVQQLGDITFIDLPPVGRELKQQDVLCEVESVKAASDIYMPVSGKIVEVNESLSTDPSAISSDPEKSGWIVKIEPADQEDIQSLMDSEKYKDFISSLE